MAGIRSDLEAELRGEEWRQVDELGVADDRPAQALDTDQGAQPRAGQVHRRERGAGNVELVDAAVDERDSLELGAAKVQAVDLAALEHDVLELGTGEVDVAKVRAPDPDV